MGLKDLEINVKPDEDDEEELEIVEEDEDELEDEEDIVDEEDSEEEDKEKSLDEDEDEDEEVEVRSRENDRIRSLVESEKILESKINEEIKEKYEIKKKLIETQKTARDTNVAILEGHVKLLKMQMAKAQEEGDSNSFVDLNEQMAKALADVKALKTWEPETLEEPKEFKKKEQKEQVDVASAPAAAKKWLGKNSWFTNPQSPRDIKRQKEAIVYGQILESDGYSLESEDYFRMLDKRLEKLGLAKSKKSNVNSKESSDEGRKTEKRKISQTVQGASKVAQSKQNSKNKVTLTVEQQKIADLYGMSYAEYARELLKIENAKKNGQRMTTL